MLWRWATWHITNFAQIKYTLAYKPCQFLVHKHKCHVLVRISWAKPLLMEAQGGSLHAMSWSHVPLKDGSSLVVPVAMGCNNAFVVSKLLNNQPSMMAYWADNVLVGIFIYMHMFNKQGRHMPKIVTYIHPCFISYFAITRYVQQTHQWLCLPICLPLQLRGIVLYEHLSHPLITKT